MSASNTCENSLALLIFQNTAFAGIGDASGLQPSATTGSLYVSLHTSDPGEAGNQTTNEASYGSYARVAVARTSGGWTVTANVIDNTAAVNFPQCSSGSETITHFGVGTDNTGTGTLLFSGSISSPAGGLAVSTGITPSFSAGDLDITFD